MSYNVENLFDCRHDSLKNDYEFLPEGDKHWNSYRYWQKLKDIAKVIAAVGEEQLPDVVGLCEVENDLCLFDLTRRSILRTAGYSYVMTHSKDERGVDVALLYQPARFKPVAVENIEVNLPSIGGKPTRDILHVTAQVQSGDSLDVYMCHMPSRSGGQQASEHYRLFAAQVLRQHLDSVMQSRPNARILIMGDFNDYPQDKALSQVLKASDVKNRKVRQGTGSGGALYNLMIGLKPGTYRYQGEWNTLDQIIVSESLLPAKAQIFTANWLQEKDNNYGGYKPFRTYQGPRYLGGYSDHLPVYVDLP